MAILQKSYLDKTWKAVNKKKNTRISQCSDHCEEYLNSIDISFATIKKEIIDKGKLDTLVTSLCEQVRPLSKKLGTHNYEMLIAFLMAIQDAIKEDPKLKLEIS